MRIQKGYPRFCKRELWNLDSTLAPIIHQGLTQFKDSKRYGFPMTAVNQYLEEVEGLSKEQITERFKENPNEVRDLVYKNLNNKQELENIARIYNVNPNDLVREANTINQGNNQLQPPVPQLNQVNVIKKQPKVSDAELKAFFQKNIDNPDVIVQASKKFNFTINDLSRATGYSSKELAGYFKNAGLMTN